MADWVKVAQAGELEPGMGKVVEAKAQTLALFNVDGAYYAIDNTCTHVGGPLGDGEMTGDVVHYPWHGAGFNVKTGAVASPPARAGVRTYPVKVEGNDVLVEVD